MASRKSLFSPSSSLKTMQWRQFAQNTALPSRPNAAARLGRAGRCRSSTGLEFCREIGHFGIKLGRDFVHPLLRGLERGEETLERFALRGDLGLLFRNFTGAVAAAHFISRESENIEAYPAGRERSSCNSWARCSSTWRRDSRNNRTRSAWDLSKRVSNSNNEDSINALF